MRGATIILLMVWAYGAGALWGHSIARAGYCGNFAYPSVMPLLTFAWPLAAAVVSLEGIDATKSPCKGAGK